MLHLKSKKNILPLYLCVLTALFSPSLTQAEPYGTGDIASKRAAEQRAAIAKRAEKKKHEDEAQKAVKTQQAKSAEDQKPTDEQKEIPATQ